jgi:hypothetical protein
MRILLVLLILLSAPVAGQGTSVQYGTIKLTIENRPPVITSLTILPSEPYFDSVLECVAEIEDETPDTVAVDYKWYKNGILQDVTSGKFQGQDNDEITCIATPTDALGLTGESKAADTKILPSPFHVKIMKPALGIMGIDANAEELTKGTSMSAVTGMVVGRGSSEITLVFLLGIFALILVLLNSILLFSRKKIRYPTQG